MGIRFNPGGLSGIVSPFKTSLLNRGKADEQALNYIRREQTMDVASQQAAQQKAGPDITKVFGGGGGGGTT